jgi:hypothetical protein
MLGISSTYILDHVTTKRSTEQYHSLMSIGFTFGIGSMKHVQK